MEQYNITYNRTISIVLAIVLPPVILIPAFIFTMANYAPSMPEWAEITTIIALLAITFLVVFIAIKRINNKAVLTLKEDGFVIEFPIGMSYQPSFEIKAADIIYIGVIDGEGSHYLNIKTRKRGKFNIGPATNNSDDRASFDLLTQSLNDMMEKANTNLI
ncbi:MAG: hypothetical protein K0Q79_2425 [Flavipsychrobacter sp.]|jgi:hypothetical protein|nr:hypothetical protein [Flavipsychrobacter sp.]